MCATQLRICANLSPQVNQENSLADAEMEVAAWLEAAKQAAKRQAQGTQAWFEQNFHIRELERQLHHGRQLIASLQEVARHGSQTLRLLQNACKERDRLSHQLAVFKAQMPPPQPPSTRALWMGQLAAHATNEPPCEESLPPRESTPKPAPASAPQVPLTSLRIKFRKYKHEDQLKHNKPPWRLKVSLLVAKLSQQAVPAEPILQSPRPLGPTSFAGAAALLSAPLPTQQGGVAPQPMHQSIVQMLHVGGVRLGYVPVHRSAVQQPRRADAACDRPRSSRGHPFVINGFRQSEREFECATPAASEADPNEVLVCETPPCRQTTIHCVAAPSSSSNVMHVSETSDTD